jgi:hypothetical protein
MTSKLILLSAINYCLIYEVLDMIRMNFKSIFFVAFSLLQTTVFARSSTPEVLGKSTDAPLFISGVYPHLALFNHGKYNNSNTTVCDTDGWEGGIGAIVSWAGKLWMITYSPHCPYGSSDKLYSIDNNLTLTIHPESIGGTPANRLIHRESKQLIISNYFIDSIGNIRTIPLSKMPGRITATARHLLNPANMVYFYDMEGMLYEANVNTLAVTKLFNKPIPGWHGKGAYSSQNVLVLANNGEFPIFPINPADLKVGGLPKNSEEMGFLATWNGKEEWKQIERKQFTDVTGPGGIYGAPDDTTPLWTIGWDRRSVILKLLDNGNWSTYRLPKAAHTYDHRGGWYNEWPRIREVGNDQMLMDMHGMLYDFPKTFSLTNSAGLKAIGAHLRLIDDFTYWNGRLILTNDETTLLQNPYPGRCYANLWFGQYEDLKTWGGATGWGGPWANDSVKANVTSDAFLINGFEKTVLHLAHNATKPVMFTLELDKIGNNQWSTYKTITVDETGYTYFIFPADTAANWIRFKTDTDCGVSVYFHFTGKYQSTSVDPMFNALADATDSTSFDASLIRPAQYNTNFQVLSIIGTKTGYMEVDEKLEFSTPADNRTDEMLRILKLNKDFDVDEASVKVTDFNGTFRLPKGDPAFDQPFNGYWPRGIRELESERYMLNVHGSFYEVGREAGYVGMRPVSTHNKKIMDFATWRGLLVLTGTNNNATADGHYFPSQQGNGLWFGMIDDLWKLGKPRGEGAVWKNLTVKANQTSWPYLMAGYDKKTVSITTDANVNIILEVDVDLNGWHHYKTIQTIAGETIEHVFPDGYSAHWIRTVTDKACTATISFKYE